MPHIHDSHKYPTDKFNPIIAIPEPLPGERWSSICNVSSYDILPYYAISTYGRLVHIYEKIFMKTSWDGSGYRIAVLQTSQGAKTFRVHRLLMLTFRYFEGCENLVVDHINGNKAMNYIEFPIYNQLTGLYELKDNLRWTTQSENEKYAFELGLKNPSYGRRTITEEQAHEICKLLEENKLRYVDIAEKIGTTIDVVQMIARRKTFTNISSNYKFERRVTEYLTEDKVREVCSLLEKKVPMKDISNITGVKYDIVKHIHQKRAWASISCEYNI